MYFYYIRIGAIITLNLTQARRVFMAKPKKHRKDPKEDTESMLREYWETLESEPKQREVESDNVKKSSQDQSSDG